MLGLVSVGAGAGFVAKNAVVEPVAARAEIYPDWTCAVNKISATSDSTSSVIYGEVVLPSTPTVTGYVGANQCGCPRVVAAAAGA